MPHRTLSPERGWMGGGQGGAGKRDGSVGGEEGEGEGDRWAG